jgi:hypothetical protein
MEIPKATGKLTAMSLVCLVSVANVWYTFLFSHHSSLIPFLYQHQSNSVKLESEKRGNDTMTNLASNLPFYSSSSSSLQHIPATNLVKRFPKNKNSTSFADLNRRFDNVDACGFPFSACKVLTSLRFCEGSSGIGGNSFENGLWMGE